MTDFPQPQGGNEMPRFGRCGTRSPEVGGLTSMQGLEIVRGCRGLNLVGGDLVEVSPPCDISGMTSQLAANILYEMLCVLPGVRYTEKKA